MEDNLIQKEAQRTQARDWRARAIGTDLECPSGNVALVKRIGPDAFLAKGFVPDHLAPVINEYIRQGQGMKPQEIEESANDPEKLADMMELIDYVVAKAVVEPKVSLAPGCLSLKTPKGDKCNGLPSDSLHIDKSNEFWHTYVEDDRNEDILYTDEIMFEDKSFIFQYALGGSKDLERFRAESERTMAALSNS